MGLNKSLYAKRLLMSLRASSTLNKVLAIFYCLPGSIMIIISIIIIIIKIIII